MGNHEYCDECGENDFHRGEPCNPEKRAAHQARRSSALRVDVAYHRDLEIDNPYAPVDGIALAKEWLAEHRFYGDTFAELCAAYAAERISELESQRVKVERQRDCLYRILLEGFLSSGKVSAEYEMGWNESTA